MEVDKSALLNLLLETGCCNPNPTFLKNYLSSPDVCCPKTAFQVAVPKVLPKLGGLLFAMCQLFPWVFVTEGLSKTC